MSAAGPEYPKNVLVVRLGAMGDVIHTMYAVALLRHELPETQIGWVVEERWAELLCAGGRPRSGDRSSSRPLVDFVHMVNTKAWRRSPLAGETRHQFSAALKEIRDQKYDLAIDFQGAIKSALLSKLSRPKALLGMEEPREGPARLLYSQRVQIKRPHVVQQYCSLTEAVLAHLHRRTSFDQAGALEFPLDETAEQVISRKLQNIGRPIVIVSPGAGWGAKQWPTERYGEVSRELAKKEGAYVLVNYGPGEEQLAKDVQDSSGGAAQPITCSIAELIAVTRRCSLLIGGDTGPLHLAAAMSVPVVAIFGPTDPARNGPYSDKSIVLRNPASRTSLSHVTHPDPGLLQITPNEVLAAARKLLENNRG